MVRESKKPPEYDYNAYTRIAGRAEIAPPTAKLPYRVCYRRPQTAGRFWKYIGSASLIAIALCFFGWMFGTASHYPSLKGSLGEASCILIMFGSVAVIETFRCFNMITLSMASCLARDPVPVFPQSNQRVAFLTTIVPAKEPLSMAEATLRAAGNISYDGQIDIWLLDEGDDDRVKAMCARNNVHHFSRKGIPRYNAERGAFKARSKHGNYNSWISEHGGKYDYMMSVDTDHVPHPAFAQRMLAYFKDPNVAFVVGPQVYGNYDNIVTKGAESMQFVFHALIQRMGNFHRCAMFVGTNNAVRLSAIQQIGGFRDSITEDMATSMVFHSRRNPVTGKRWESVYTPDVLAVGEGPSSFTDLFSQQYRWSRGTFDVLTGHFWRCFWGLSFRAKVHYLMIAAYYPTSAISWILGAVNYVLYLLLGTTPINVPSQWWIAIYSDLALVLLYTYAVNRKHNVSPHEPEGGLGAAGMFFSVLCFPIYVLSFYQTIIGRSGGFVVTPKGDAMSPDRLTTFRQQLSWGMLFATVFAVSAATGTLKPGMVPWVVGLVLVSVAGPLMWLGQRIRRNRIALRRESEKLELVTR